MLRCLLSPGIEGDRRPDKSAIEQREEGIMKMARIEGVKAGQQLNEPLLLDHCHQIL